MLLSVFIAELAKLAADGHDGLTVVIDTDSGTVPVTSVRVDDGQIVIDTGADD